MEKLPWHASKTLGFLLKALDLEYKCLLSPPTSQKLCCHFDAATQSPEDHVLDQPSWTWGWEVVLDGGGGGGVAVKKGEEKGG